jgi:threonine dehydrogenase-like Zn-dependent dehydrogenase
VSREDLLDAAIAIVSEERGAVAVAGEGTLARDLRERLRPRLADPGAGASVVIETTGEPEQIARALTSVEDLGVIVLAGPPPAEPVALDLYGDLHVRGLRMIGVRAGVAKLGPG